MASHVSDTERVIFWTKWRFQQCFNKVGKSEKLGELCRNKKKLSVVVIAAVFVLLILRTRLLGKVDETSLDLKLNSEDEKFDWNAIEEKLENEVISNLEKEKNKREKERKGVLDNPKTFNDAPSQMDQIPIPDVMDGKNSK